MATQQTAHDDPTIEDREQDILRAEAEVDIDEQQLETDLERARAEASELADVLRRFADKVAEAQADRGEVNELTQLSQRVRDVVVPAIDLDGHRERQLTVRADSVRARIWVVKAMRQELRRFSQDLGYVASLIDEGQEAIENLDAPAAEPEPRGPRKRRLVRRHPTNGGMAAVSGLGPDGFVPDPEPESEPPHESTLEFTPAALASVIVEPEPEAQAAPTMMVVPAVRDEAATARAVADTADIAAVDPRQTEATVIASAAELLGGADEVEETHTVPPRHSPRVRMEARIDMHSDSNFFNGFSANISDGGVFIATDHDVAIGTEVELAFTLPSGIEIRGRGIVRWGRGSAGDGQIQGVGVQFENLSGAAREAIGNFIQSRDPIFYPM